MFVVLAPFERLVIGDILDQAPFKCSLLSESPKGGKSVEDPPTHSTLWKERNKKRTHYCTYAHVYSVGKASMSSIKDPCATRCAESLNESKLKVYGA